MCGAKMLDPHVHLTADVYEVWLLKILSLADDNALIKSKFSLLAFLRPQVKCLQIFTLSI